MFEVKTVTNCPVTRETKGVVRIAPWILGELLGTMQAEAHVEWAAVLTGSASEDGLTVEVTGIRVPTGQVRSTGSVKLGEIEMAPEIVGAWHSHHSMGAFFSGTDDTDINRKFRVSIVGSTKLEDKQPESSWLGFAYKAEGRVKLPCGALGVVPFVLEPLGVEDWPARDENVGKWPTVTAGHLGDCVHQELEEEDAYYETRSGKCGVKGLGRKPKVGVFGTGAGKVTELLPKPSNEYRYSYGPRNSQTGLYRGYWPEGRGKELEPWPEGRKRYIDEEGWEDLGNGRKRYVGPKGQPQGLHPETVKEAAQRQAQTALLAYPSERGNGSSEKPDAWEADFKEREIQALMDEDGLTRWEAEAVYAHEESREAWGLWGTEPNEVSEWNRLPGSQIPWELMTDGERERYVDDVMGWGEARGVTLELEPEDATELTELESRAKELWWERFERERCE